MRKLSIPRHQYFVSLTSRELHAFKHVAHMLSVQSGRTVKPRDVLVAAIQCAYAEKWELGCAAYDAIPVYSAPDPNADQLDIPVDADGQIPETELVEFEPFKPIQPVAGVLLNTDWAYLQQLAGPPFDHPVADEEGEE